MLVIISSKVRTAAHCNYTCAAISVWWGKWVERCGKRLRKGELCSECVCSQTEKNYRSRCDFPDNGTRECNSVVLLFILRIPAIS